MQPTVAIREPSTRPRGIIVIRRPTPLAPGAEDALFARLRAARFEARPAADSLAEALAAVARRHEAAGLPVGVLAWGAAAAEALGAAIDPARVGAVVCLGGPLGADVAVLAQVRSPVLCVVGARDAGGLAAMDHAFRELPAVKELVVVPRVRDLDEEPAREEVARLATHWFDRFLGAGRVPLRRSGMTIPGPQPDALTTAD